MSASEQLTYDVLVVWHSNWHKPRLRTHSRWHRGVQADSLTDACNKALGNHTDAWNPQVSMCWPNHRSRHARQER